MRLPLVSRALRLAAAPGVCLCLALALFACGSDGDDDTTAANAAATPGAAQSGSNDALTANLLTDDEVEQAQDDERLGALLSWWQAVQYQDVATAYRMLSPGLRRDESRRAFAADVVDAAAAFVGRPRLAGVTEDGDRVVLRVNIEYVGGDAKVTAVVPRSFSLTRQGGDWQIADTTFLRAEAAKRRQPVP